MQSSQDSKTELEGQIVQVNVLLYAPFVDFIRDYLAYFGSKDTLETFCMKAVYDKCGLLEYDLTEFVKNQAHNLNAEGWFWKHGHVAITSDQPEDDEDE